MQHNKQKHQVSTNSMDSNKLKEESPAADLNIPVDQNNEEQLNGIETNEIKKLEEELADQKDKYLRLLAEFDNFKRRSARENMEIRQTAGKEIITTLLDVMDDCDRAEKQMQTTDDVQQIKEGVQLVFNKLRNTLQATGLKAMESMNTEFDVHKHEAITEIPVDDTDKKGKVVDEIVKGYYLNDKLIRFAKVVVGK